MYLQDPPDDAAVTAVYAAAEADAGYLMNYVRGWAWRPDVAAAFSSARSALAAETALGARDIAVINAVVARARENAYCGTAWGSKLADQTSPEVAAAVLRGGDDALDERGRALARFADLLMRETSGEITLDGRRLGFVYRNLLANLHQVLSVIDLQESDRFFNALENFQESPPRLTALRDPAALAAAAKKLNSQ